MSENDNFDVFLFSIRTLVLNGHLCLFIFNNNADDAFLIRVLK